MADTKFSQFTDGSELLVGDQPVGLRPSDPTANYIFDFPGDGIKDANGNWLLQYDTAGAASVNYPNLTNSVSGSAVVYGAGGTDTNIDVSIQPQGSGQLILDDLNWPASDGAAGTFLQTDGAGNLSFTSGVATSITGTADQVLANGTSGSAQTGAVTLTTPQDINTTSSPTFAALTLTSPLTLANGGTSKALTASNGGIVYTDSNSMEILAGTATAAQMLQSGSSSAPAWSTSTWPATTTANQILYSSSTNTVDEISAANSAVLVSDSSGTPTFTSTMTNGQLAIGSTGATPTAAALTAGAGINITNGAGSITISAGGSGFSWNEETGTSANMAVNNGYIANNAGLVTLTLPASAAIGDSFSIVGKGAGGWLVQADTGQTIYYGNSTSSVAGSLASTHRRDCVEIICITANTEFQVVDSVGSITVA